METGGLGGGCRGGEDWNDERMVAVAEGDGLLVHLPRARDVEEDGRLQPGD